MRTEQQIRFVASFYEHWDHDLERRLVEVLEIDLSARIATMSPGNVQKIAIVLALCHHPGLLLLDEPLSDLDPIARETMLTMLLDLFRDEGVTIVVSSHVLRDVERIVDSVICLEHGRVIVDEPLDALQERFAEWVVRSPEGRLPVRFNDAFVLSQQGDGYQMLLKVMDPTRHLETFRQRYRIEVESSPLNLERIFPMLVGSDRNEDPTHPGALNQENARLVR